MSLITPEDLRAFLVLGNRDDQIGTVLDHICRATYAKMLNYSDRTCLALNPETGSSGVGSLNTLTDSGKGWTVSAYVGQVLVDSAGSVFLISANDATTLTVSGTPASGAYSIYEYLTERYFPRYILGEHLRLRSWPLRGVLTIYEDDDTTDTLTIDDDYKALTAVGELHRYGGWKDPEFYWTIKYVGGYLPTDPEWPLLRHWQLSLGDAMWNDSGYKRFVADQYGQMRGTLNYELTNSNIFESICHAMGARFRRVTL